MILKRLATLRLRSSRHFLHPRVRTISRSITTSRSESLLPASRLQWCLKESELALGAQYARKISRTPVFDSQTNAIYAGHGNTDREHIQDLWRVIAECELSALEWQWMNFRGGDSWPALWRDV